VDTDDPSFPVDLMGGQPYDQILGTIYNGSETCTSCGSLINPAVALYLGSICPDCFSAKKAKHNTQMIGK
jgi:hypothetical protein